MLPDQLSACEGKAANATCSLSLGQGFCEDDGLLRVGTETCDSGPGNADEGACTLACEANQCDDGIAVDGLGHVYIADRDHHRIRRIECLAGIAVTVDDNGARVLQATDTCTGTLIEMTREAVGL